MKHFALILAAAALVACKPKGDAATPIETSGAGATSASAPEQPAAAPEEPQSEPSSEKQCADDRQCERYDRCEDGICKVPPAVDGRLVEGMPVATFKRGDEEVAKFNLEIADEPWERTRGLMFRRKMDPNFGMLFIFPDEEVRSFWMKNTYIPLDMVHIDAAGRVVGVVANAEPLTLSPRRTGKPARYVLELTSGRAAEVGIETGDVMDVENLPENLSPK